MNDTAIKNFCVWARIELMSGVRQRMMQWHIAAGKDATADTLDGRVLSDQQKRQRAELLDKVARDGEEALAERAAYTWFNRMLAIRYMEVNDRLPSGVRVLSAPDGSFAPQVLKSALALDIEGLSRQRVLELVQAGDDEETFRYLFLAQCEELAACMPAVFEPVGSAMELLLPSGLLRQGSIVQRMVDDIDEADWREGVEIVGWAYQYYVSERKDKVFESFKKGKKAERADIAPATQLFTPHWIVRYMTENSLGRLWMLNKPHSSVRDLMEFFIEPDAEAPEDFKSIQSPEEIRVVDPACGSGHILVYAFDLLAHMYEESGYARRDIPQQVLKNNIVGFEIDPRAAAMASFALTMKALEYDSRFLRRGVTPSVVVLQRIEFEELELEAMPLVAGRARLLDALAHMDECGSLFAPEASDVTVLRDACEALHASGSIFASSAREKLQAAVEMLEPLMQSYDVVIANPPYMGSSNMNAWLSKWIAKEYPDFKRDMFSAFVIRNMGLGTPNAELGFMTPYVWMFISSYEKLRQELIDQHTLTSLVQLEYSGFAGATVPICTFTLCNAHICGYKGAYVRLSDFVGADNQAPKTLEAIKNPECGWFYRANADAFKDIPGSPIAYWASDAMINAFGAGAPLGSIATPRQGLATSDNNRFLRKWWELPTRAILRNAQTREEARISGYRWFPIIRGGAYRKWFGVYDEVVDWFDDGQAMKQAVLKKYPYLSTPDFVIKNQNDYFKPAVTWSKISSSLISFRYAPEGMLFEVAGACIFADDLELRYLQGACNSSSMLEIASMLSPTLNFEVGQVATYPIIHSDAEESKVAQLVEQCREISKQDYDSFETSWDFKRHPLV